MKRFNYKRVIFIIAISALSIFGCVKANMAGKTWLSVLILVIWFIIASLVVLCEAADENEFVIKSRALKRYCPNCRKKTIQTQFLSKFSEVTKGDYWQCDDCGEILDFVE